MFIWKSEGKEFQPKGPAKTNTEWVAGFLYLRRSRDVIIARASCRGTVGDEVRKVTMSWVG